MGEKSKEGGARPLLPNVTDGEQCCGLKCVFWSLTAETTRETMEAA